MIQFKGYAGNKDARDIFAEWLINGQFNGLVITGQWDPEEEWGSWGVEFSYANIDILKLIKKEFGKKGVVAERSNMGIT